MVPVLVEDIEVYLKLTDLDFKSKFDITGGFEDDRMKIDGRARGDNIFVLKESFDSLKASFRYRKEKIFVDGIELKKSDGAVTGTYSYDTLTEIFDYKLRAAGLKLGDFDFYNFVNLGYNGRIDGEVQRPGPPGRHGFPVRKRN